MIARFIYTDCMAAGPFNASVGKKFKSVVFPSALASGAQAIESLKERLPRNSLSDGYELPNVPNAMTMAEFNALPKSWAFAQITPDTFAFERIGTAGQCYGRNNRFDEGFVLSPEAWTQLNEHSAGATRPTSLRPVDFVHSTGWLNPRGDAELEAATLDDSFYVIEPTFREQLKTDLALVKRLPNVAALAKGFAHSQLSGTATIVPKSQASDFFAIVSIFTRLTAPVYAWQTGFSDVWEKPRDVTLADGRNPHFVLSNDPSPQPSGLATLWASIAAEAFAAGIPGKLMAKLDDLATTTFALNPAMRGQGLTLLPLAILLTNSEDMVGKEHLVNLAVDYILNCDDLPSAWLGDSEDRVLDGPKSLTYHRCSKSDDIEGWLARIGGAA